MKILFTSIWLLYFISPFDLIPERFAPGLGFIDDLLLAGFFYILYYQYKLPRKKINSKLEESSDLKAVRRSNSEGK